MDQVLQRHNGIIGEIPVECTAYWISELTAGSQRRRGGCADPHPCHVHPLHYNSTATTWVPNTD